VTIPFGWPKNHVSSAVRFFCIAIIGRITLAQNEK